jgi:ribosomal 50S subunit-recycling heat shock protein
MRLDKFLKVTRLIKRRTVANEACDNEHLSVNGKVAKASYQVKIGDEIAITFGEKTLKVRVLSLSESIHKSEVLSMYEVID